MSNDFIDEESVQTLMNTISEFSPNCIATVMADNHGFLIASKLSRMYSSVLDTELLALQAITNRQIVDLKGYKILKRKIASDVNLFVITKKKRFKSIKRNKLKKIITKNGVF